MSTLFRIFVESMQARNDKYESVERWRRKSKVAELGIHILAEITRKSIIRGERASNQTLKNTRTI